MLLFLYQKHAPVELKTTYVICYILHVVVYVHLENPHEVFDLSISQSLSGVTDLCLVKVLQISTNDIYCENPQNTFIQIRQLLNRYYLS